MAEECTKKTWLEEYIKDNATLEDRAMAYMMSKEICKKILEECQKKWEKIQSEVTSVYNDKDLMPHDIKNIINELGVQI